jgi:hypothetical protein
MFRFNFIQYIFLISITIPSLLLAESDIQHKAFELVRVEPTSGANTDQSSASGTPDQQSDPHLLTDFYLIEGDSQKGASSIHIEDFNEDVVRIKFTPGFKIKKIAVFDIKCGSNTKSLSAWLKVIKATNTAPKLTLSKGTKFSTTVDNVTGDPNYGMPPATVVDVPGIYRVKIEKTKPPASEEVEMKVMYGCFNANGGATTVDDFDVIQLQ